MTVLASAVGPLLLALCVDDGSYAAGFYTLSAVVAALAVAAAGRADSPRCAAAARGRR